MKRFLVLYLGTGLKQSLTVWSYIVHGYSIWNQLFLITDIWNIKYPIIKIPRGGLIVSAFTEQT